MEEKTCPTAEKLKKERKKHTGIKDVRFVLAVGSGKGGVGKTTVSALLGLALKEAGYSVGIFDLDFYGPNINLVLGIKNKKPLIEFGKIKPVLGAENIKVLSLALMISEKDPIFMRGLMASKLLQELLEKVEWGPLDFLILDLPPGTGDIFLTMLDLFNPEGFILVTTSHKLAISDAKRTVVILKEMEVPILGVIKNMAGFFENEEVFNNFLQEQHLSLIFEVPVFKELATVENLQEVVALPERKNLLNELADKVLDRVFRIH
jgi:ATP-binding protein involved in chromosome partitioning